MAFRESTRIYCFIYLVAGLLRLSGHEKGCNANFTISRITYLVYEPCLYRCIVH